MASLECCPRFLQCRLLVACGTYLVYQLPDGCPRLVQRRHHRHAAAAASSRRQRCHVSDHHRRCERVQAAGWLIQQQHAGVDEELMTCGGGIATRRAEVQAGGTWVEGG